MTRCYPYIASALFVILSIFSPANSTAQTASAAQDAVVGIHQLSLEERLNHILKDEITERTFFGVHVEDAETGDVLFDNFGRHLFTPASNMKLYSSACALAAWGADYRFATEIGVNVRKGEKLENGVLPGNLVLRGAGDPTLTSADLSALARRVRDELGIKKIQGSLIVDESRFSDPGKGPGWMWDDDPDYYNMSVGSIMLDYNVLGVKASPGAKAGAEAVVEFDPPSTYPRIVNTSKTFDPAKSPGKKSNLTVTRKPFESTVRIDGEIALDASPVTRRLTPHNPDIWVGHVFKQMLEDEGIEIDHKLGFSKTPLGGDPALSHPSKPLSEILKLFNKPSENAIGETLLLNLSYDAGKRPVSWKSGADVIGKWLTETVGLDSGDFRLVDGSGLSRYNLITPEGTSKLLRHMWGRPDRQVFIDSLPTAGVDGTLRSRMRDLPDGAQIFAKTGTMSGASTISGYVTTKSGRRLVFSIMSNGFVGSSRPVRALQDRLCVAIAME